MNSHLKAVVLAVAVAQLAVAGAASGDDSTLACDVGPVQRQFGSTAWNIYACSDGKSAVVVPVKVVNGQAGYFFLTPSGKTVTVAGEGWGKDATFRPVYQQLQRITLAELKAIIKAAHSVKPHHVR